MHKESSSNRQPEIAPNKCAKLLIFTCVEVIAAFKHRHIWKGKEALHSLFSCQTYLKSYEQVGYSLCI